LVSSGNLDVKTDKKKKLGRSILIISVNLVTTKLTRDSLGI